MKTRQLRNSPVRPKGNHEKYAFFDLPEQSTGTIFIVSPSQPVQLELLTLSDY
ncbi:MAG: hypothetical protein H0X66_03080 [Verrucomicrobia bacterium]|nr:hypothetical protein [Verrucomicrobiota bacterium]